MSKQATARGPVEAACRLPAARIGGWLAVGWLAGIPAAIAGPASEPTPVPPAARAPAALTQEIEDPGKETVARVSVHVLLATNGDASVAGSGAGVVPAETVARLRAEERLRFTHYRLLGQDRRRVYRSYENWAQPLAPSDEVLVRFEAQGKPRDTSQRLDIELWLSRKKILKTDAVIGAERPLFILGPQWRGGHLIIMLTLAPKPVVSQ